MFSTMIHDITHLTISEPIEKKGTMTGPYYVRNLVALTKQGNKCAINLFGDSLAALTTTESKEPDYWRTQAAKESARAYAAESELACLRQAIDKIAQGVETTANE